MSATGTPAAVTSTPLWQLLGAVPGAWAVALVLGLGTSALLVAGGRDFGLSATQSLIVALVPLLVAVAVLFPVGWFLGRHWPNAVVITSLVLGVLGMLLTAFAPSAMVVGLGRAVVGVGVGAVLGVAAVLLSRVGSGRSVTALVSVLVFVVAAVAAWFAGTALEVQLGFRPVLFLSCIALVAAGLLAVVAAVLGLVRRS